MSLKAITSFLMAPYAVFLVVFLVVYLWKVSGFFWVDGISDHLSNFGLTGVGCLLFIGPLAFRRKTTLWWVVSVAVFFIAANIAVEVLAIGSLNGFNVVDEYDAVYGMAAALIVVGLYLIVTRGKRSGRA